LSFGGKTAKRTRVKYDVPAIERHKNRYYIASVGRRQLKNETILILCQHANHRRSQDLLWGALFSSKKSTTFFIVALKTQTQTAKLTTATLQISPPRKNFLKNYTLALPVGALTTFPYKFALPIFSPPWGMHT